VIPRSALPRAPASRGLQLLAAIVAAGVASGAVALWPHEPVHGDDGVPTAVVLRAPFVRRVAADGSLRAVTSRPVTAPSELTETAKLVWLAEDGIAVHRGDVVARLDATDAMRDVHDAEATLVRADAELRSQRISSGADLAKTEVALVNATTDLDQQRAFQPTDPALYSRDQIEEAAIDVDVAAAREAQAALAARIGHGTARSGVQLAAFDRDKAKLALDRASVALTAMDIRAPADGVLVLLRDDAGAAVKPGTEVWPGETIGEVPDVTAMEAELFVLEVDGDGLAVGQGVDLELASRPDAAFHGTVRLVDRLAKPRSGAGPVPYVSVVVTLAGTDAAVMKPGARVHGVVAISAKPELAVPRQAIVERDGRAFVYRRSVAGLLPVAVEVGAATAGRVAVTHGLADGDIFALRAPGGARGDTP
jgi:HlyD family secretion protein